MKIKFAHLILPVFAAVLVANYVSVEFWDTSKSAILTALAVIAAAVLVRLARGLPFTNTDQFQLDEARKISKAIKYSIKALRTLIIVIFVIMVFLVMAQGISNEMMIKWPAEASRTDAIISGIIGLLLSYIFIRMITVIQGDVSLVNMQADFFVKAIERKQEEKFGKQVQQSNSLPLANPNNYGKIIK